MRNKNKHGKLAFEYDKLIKQYAGTGFIKAIEKQST
jgi:hypothetical protein